MSANVSAHAVFRWLTRVMGVPRYAMLELAIQADVTPTEGNLVDLTLAHVGLTRPQVEDVIAPADARTAIRLGAARVHRPGFTLICSDGLVVTILDSRPGLSKGRAQRIAAGIDGREYSRKGRRARDWMEAAK